MVLSTSGLQYLLLEGGKRVQAHNLFARHVFNVVLVLIIGCLSCAGAAAETYEVVAWQAQGPVKIDGKLNEWNLSSSIVLAAKDQVILNETFWGGKEDQSAEFWFMWDVDNLYLAGNVVDDVPFVMFPGFDLDSIDSIALYFSTDPKADPERTTWNSTDFKIFLVMDNDYFETLIDRSMVISRRGIETGPLVGYEVAIKKTALGYIVEVRIPWSNFSNDRIPIIEPDEDVRIGFTLEVYDLDQPCPGAEASALSWTGKSGSRPRNWGFLIFKK